MLDEINNAAYYGLIEIEATARLLPVKSSNTALLLTGKFVDERLVKVADTVHEFINIKHPYDNGILARKGFDY